MSHFVIGTLSKLMIYYFLIDNSSLQNAKKNVFLTMMEKREKQQQKEYKPGDTYEVPAEGSLGLLALGYRGLEAWRKAQDKVKSKLQPQNETGKDDVLA